MGHGVKAVQLIASPIRRVIAVLLGVAAVAVFTYQGPEAEADNELQQQVAGLRADVFRLQQQQSMPALVLNRHRDSICYIYAIYSVRMPLAGAVRERVSGTGFVVGDGLIATNRHVVQPWFNDPDAKLQRQRGARFRLEKLVAFFPGTPGEVRLSVSGVSKTADVAIARFTAPKRLRPLKPLPLASATPSPGDPVVVVGYPMGTVAMVAKSPEAVYQRLASNDDTLGVVHELANRSLVRPSATYGHLGDVVGEKLIYDAPTAHGGSGGPVFNFRGEVIAVNSAYIVGFAGGTLGVSVEALRELLEKPQRPAVQGSRSQRETKN